jgi:hypothetical protein
VIPMLDASAPPIVPNIGMDAGARGVAGRAGWSCLRMDSPFTVDFPRLGRLSGGRRNPAKELSLRRSLVSWTCGLSR